MVIRKITTALLFTLVIFLFVYYFLPRYTSFHLPLSSIPQTSIKEKDHLKKLKAKADQIDEYASTKRYSTDYCFLLDMSLPSGRNRFFIYSLKGDSIVASGLVAHGSCNTTFLEEAKFSNTPGCGCSAIGKYKVGYSYKGRFGKAYKLFGLDNTNSKSFDRNIVLHAYKCIPDKEIYPQPICNSLGCPMVSYQFLKTAASYLDESRKPILLWIFQ